MIYCTDEAQKAETVLSAVTYIFIYIVYSFHFLVRCFILYVLSLHFRSVLVLFFFLVTATANGHQTRVTTESIASNTTGGKI